MSIDDSALAEAFSVLRQMEQNASMLSLNHVFLRFAACTVDPCSDSLGNVENADH